MAADAPILKNNINSHNHDPLIILKYTFRFPWLSLSE